MNHGDNTLVKHHTVTAILNAVQPALLLVGVVLAALVLYMQARLDDRYVKRLDYERDAARIEKKLDEISTELKRLIEKMSDARRRDVP